MYYSQKDSVFKVHFVCINERYLCSICVNLAFNTNNCSFRPVTHDFNAAVAHAAVIKISPFPPFMQSCRPNADERRTRAAMGFLMCTLIEWPRKELLTSIIFINQSD